MMDYLSKVTDKTIYCSSTHEIICKEYYLSINRVLNDLELEDISLLKEVLDIIVNYSNDFADNQTGNFFYEWLRVIPTNFTYALAGFISGLNTSEYSIKYANANIDIMIATNLYLKRLNDLDLENE